MFGVSRSGYYGWLDRQKDKDGKKKQAQESENHLKEHVREIIRKLGYVPGARTLKSNFARRYNMDVSRKKCRYLLRVMHLHANRPIKDAYKHQATHDHPYATVIDNKVDRNFFIGPRKVILTDITYLYYALCRELFYLCAFRDAYTREILGFAVSRKMDIATLVKPAYRQMMENHGHELKKPDVYLHSDQGSQYLSTTFQQMLSDDAFVQSVSGRGNSLDNSPMESFFSRMKTILLSILALADDYNTATDLVTGFLKAYNTELYQYELGALTPREFYQYAVSGVYPCDSYFGVDANRLLSVDKLIETRRIRAEQKAQKAREQAEQDRQAGFTSGGKDPMAVVNRDLRILTKQLKEWKEAGEHAEIQKTFLTSLLNRVDKAIAFITSASPELRKALWDKQEWQKHEELSYIYDMRNLF